MTADDLPPAPAITADELRARYDTATRALDPPLAIIDLDAFDDNATALARRARGVPIRVASKSVRVRYLLERVLRRPGFAGLMTYSLAESLWLCRSGVSDDLLVAYPTADRSTLRVLAADATARATITLMIDSPEHLEFLDDALGAGHPPVRVCIELDGAWRPVRSAAIHVGTRRSPVYTPRQIESLAKKVLVHKGFRLVGLMAYEGQIAGIGDAPSGHPMRAAAVRWMQRRSAAELSQRRAAAVRSVRALTELELVNGGGTGSIESTSAESAVTEVTAGSGLIGPTLFDDYARFQPRAAALFALPVVRRPGHDIATLFAGGYLASGPGDASRLPTPYLPAGLRLLGVEGAGEVQTPVAGRPADRLRIGDRVWLRHAKAGELAERFTHYHVVRGDTVIETVPTYRGENRCFG